MSGLKQRPPGKAEFQEELRAILKDAHQRGATEVIVKAADLHQKAGGYPGRNHNMPSCCDAMTEAKRPGDEVLHSPPKGKGATLSIRYKLPR